MAQPLTDVEEYVLFETPDTTMEDCDLLQRVSRRDCPRPAPRLLDLACGTGRHALEMARRGFEVLGVDRASDRIDHARAEASRLSLGACRFEVQDLLHLELEERYDCAYCLFNTISLFIRNDDVLSVLRNAGACLAPGGLLLIHLTSVWNYIGCGTFRNETYETTSHRGGLTRREWGSFECSSTNNIYRHTRRLQYSRDDMTWPEVESTVYQRMFSPNEIDLLGRLAGLASTALYDGREGHREMEDWNRFDIDYEEQDLIHVLAKRG